MITVHKDTETFCLIWSMPPEACSHPNEKMLRILPMKYHFGAHGSLVVGPEVKSNSSHYYISHFSDRDSSLFCSPTGVLCFSELFFIKEPHDVSVMRKDAVTLDCQAHGESPIAVTWLKNGVKVAENERVYILSNGSLYFSEVEIRRGDKSDEGFYQCLAQNKYGAILSQKARLTIASKYYAGVTCTIWTVGGVL